MREFSREGGWAIPQEWHQGISFVSFPSGGSQSSPYASSLELEGGEHLQCKIRKTDRKTPKYWQLRVDTCYGNSMIYTPDEALHGLSSSLLRSRFATRSKAPNHEYVSRRPRSLPELKSHRPRSHRPRSSSSTYRKRYSPLPRIYLSTHVVAQAQLSQTLFAHQIAPSYTASSSPQSYTYAHNANAARRDPSYVQHCTTPTTRTPSSSISWPAGHMPAELTQKRRSSIARPHTRRQSVDEGWCDVDELDEERMVEDMIAPSSPHSPKSFIWGYACLNAPQTPVTTPITIVGTPVESQSLFTTTDPFYLQASQAPATSQPPSSLFGNAGRPSNHSPFVRSGWEGAPMQSAATAWDR
jgi:hypothetical protein